MNHILFLISFGCFVCITFGQLEPSNQNLSHYACNTKCISKFSVDLNQCLSDTGESPDCSREQLGEQLPEEACDYTKTVLASTEEINEYFNNARFIAYTWTTIRSAFTKGPVSFRYVSEPKTGTVSNIEVIADTESTRFQCQYNFDVVQDTSKSQRVQFQNVKEANATWHWGWYYHSENVHIFRSCQSSPARPQKEPYGSIVVYVKVGHAQEGNAALQKLDFLRGVKFDNKVVQCI